MGRRPSPRRLTPARRAVAHQPLPPVSLVHDGWSVEDLDHVQVINRQGAELAFDDVNRPMPDTYIPIAPLLERHVARTKQMAAAVLEDEAFGPSGGGFHRSGGAGRCPRWSLYGSVERATLRMFSSP